MSACLMRLVVYELEIALWERNDVSVLTPATTEDGCKSPP